MNIEELKIKLNELNVAEHYYSINGHMLPNKYIIKEVYNYWECFYIDERGGQNDYHKFDNENAACCYFLKVLKREMSYHMQ